MVDPLEETAGLAQALDTKNATIQRYAEYHEGRHPLAFATDKFARAFGSKFGAFADNWCEVVVSAVEERLDVDGFRVGNNPDADPDAWDIWQANNLDAKSQMAHTAALVFGHAYATVWANPDGSPRVEVEDPRQLTHSYYPGTRTVASALKRWQDPGAGFSAVLYLPDRLVHLSSPNGAHGWRVTSDISNPLGRVPVVPLLNRPALAGAGRSELVDVIPMQDAINKLTADLIVASEFHAFRRRWATGMEIPEDPITGEPIEPFDEALGRMFVSEDPDTKFGDFQETDLTNYTEAIAAMVQHLAAISRTPPHFFAQAGQAPSGDSIKSAETGLVRKAMRRARHFGEAWEDVIRLSFAVLDDPRADEASIETVWGDPETTTAGMAADAAIKKLAVGVPQEQIWSDLGYTPTQIERFRQMSRRDTLEQIALGEGIDALPAFSATS